MPALDADYFSVIIPTYRRDSQLAAVLLRLFACNPAPAEVLIHVDAGDLDTPKMLEEKFSGKVRWICATSNRGPGGGRYVLMEMAKTPWVVTFDDDSLPESPDFFEDLNSVSDSEAMFSIFLALFSSALAVSSLLPSNASTNISG